MEDILNRKVIKIIIGLFVAIPITLLAIFFSIYGLILGSTGIIENNLKLTIIGLTTILGLIGIYGSWLRLIKSTKNISSRVQNKIRAMLLFGMASSLLLFAYSYYFNLNEITIIFLIISILNVIFIYATPKKL